MGNDAPRLSPGPPDPETVNRISKNQAQKFRGFPSSLDAIISVFEGGGVTTDDPLDPGGLTRFGVSQRSFPDEDIRNMSRSRAATLFQQIHGKEINVDKLDEPLRTALFDFAVNSGAPQAKTSLHRVLGLAPRAAMSERIVGQQTLDAIRELGVERVTRELNEDRQRFLNDLAANKPEIHGTPRPPFGLTNQQIGTARVQALQELIAMGELPMLDITAQLEPL